MTEINEVTLPTFKYLTGESANICRLCCSSTETEVYLDESRALECHYYDDIVTFEEMLNDLGVSYNDMEKIHLETHPSMQYSNQNKTSL